MKDEDEMTLQVFDLKKCGKQIFCSVVLFNLQHYRVGVGLISYDTKENLLVSLRVALGNKLFLFLFLMLSSVPCRGTLRTQSILAQHVVKSRSIFFPSHKNHSLPSVKVDGPSTLPPILYPTLRFFCTKPPSNSNQLHDQQVLMLVRSSHHV